MRQIERSLAPPEAEPKQRRGFAGAATLALGFDCVFVGFWLDLCQIPTTSLLNHNWIFIKFQLDLHAGDGHCGDAAQRCSVGVRLTAAHQAALCEDARREEARDKGEESVSLGESTFPVSLSLCLSPFPHTYTLSRTRTLAQHTLLPAQPPPLSP